MNFNEVAFEFAAGRVDQLPESDMPEIVFSGHSNVGKSSLINKLVQRFAGLRLCKGFKSRKRQMGKACGRLLCTGQTASARYSDS